MVINFELDYVEFESGIIERKLQNLKQLRKFFMTKINEV